MHSLGAQVANIVFSLIQRYSVFEIKDSPCTRRAHFFGRVHRIQDLCALQVHAFSIFSIEFYRYNARCMVSDALAPGECTE